MQSVNLNRSLTGHQQGIGLFEVLITLFIVSVGLLGLGALQINAIQSASDTGNRSQAIWIVNDIAARMKANRQGVIRGGYITNGVNCAGAAPRTCSDYHDGVNPVAGEDCSGNQVDGDGNSIAGTTGLDQAAWDLYEAFCGSPIVNNSRNAGGDFILDPALNIVCAEAPCTLTSPYDITLTWQAPNSADAADRNSFLLRVWP